MAAKKKAAPKMTTEQLAKCTFVTVNMGKEATRNFLMGEPVTVDENGDFVAQVPYHEEMVKVMGDLNPTWEISEPFVEMPEEPPPTE